MNNVGHPMLPRHIAIVMDGNGRWAKRRGLPRIAGHKVGVESVKSIVKACSTKGIEALTIFAFSTENWQRPPEEVTFLMGLILHVFDKELLELQENNVQLHVIGDRSVLNAKMRAAIEAAEQRTAANTGLKLVIAFSYSGRWDMVQAMRRIGAKIQVDELSPQEINDDVITAHLSTASFPEPDLFIRTSGEIRISNFLLWQLAYSELYFTDVLWPDFREEELDKALVAYTQRERRLGKVI
jgi:undecaprenyl diphosphate synthase